MDRRRFVPAPEGLEVRTMLATTGSGVSLLGSGTNTTQTLPITFPQKELRIQKMPTNLRALQPDRFLPPETINRIQLGLNEIISQINPAPPRGLTNYNLEMRHIVHNTSLSASNVQTLNRMFSSILIASYTPNPGLTNVVTGVNQLVSQVDTASINPTFLGTNDNAYILQLALVIGQQMPAPRAPTITKGTGHQVNRRVAITPLDAPTYVGSYEYGTTIQIVNVATGAVIGTAIVAKDGRYALHITTPLAVGKYHLAVRAVDEVGHVGHASRVFGLQVVPPKKHPA
ncbi:MAG TPA: Ig-like domain-containing protein [Candidatus Acidoferrum sp.]|nr:Ig-like domain-containing protein [Candidatus Acidoferrum sp.]